MEFIEGRIELGAGEMGWLAGLLSELNRACRTAFSRSIVQGLNPRLLTEPWTMKAGCFLRRDGSDPMLTSHQRSMVARHAKNLRTTANAKAKWTSGHLAKLAEACSKKIERTKAEIDRLSKPPGPMAKRAAHKSRTKALTQKKLALASIQGRQGRLLAKSKRLDVLAQSGLASQVFGGSQLAGQSKAAGQSGSPFKRKADWRGAWDEARSQSWLFEGDKSTSSANCSVKMDLEKGIIKVALTGEQAESRMAEMAAKLGVELATLKSSAKLSNQRMACRYLSLKLDMAGQKERFATFAEALTPSSDPKHKGKTPPCEAPVSWRIWIEGDPEKPGPCKAYARAMWAGLEAPLATFKSNGCLGVDVNAWGVSLAYCQADGNKPPKGQPFVHDRLIDWEGSSDQALHQIRVAAKEVVDGAASLGCPLALELLDFADKKAQLRYEASRKNARRLSGFACQKLFEAIVARAEKIGVEILWVDPAWTSVVGWAKYGSRLGMNPDQAAAFAIARKAILSKGKGVKRGKRPSGWVDLHAKPEKLDGLGSNAGLASKDIPAKVVKKAASYAAKHGRPAQTPGSSPGRRSKPPARASAERRLSLALGSDRRLWPERLKAAAASWERSPKPRARAARRSPGEGSGAGESSLPAKSLELGESRTSTD